MNKKILSEKYELKREIGRGGMGVIYEALHKALNRTVAIKVLHPHLTGDSAFLKRFQREARAMARLDYVNIIRVFDVGEDEGYHYIVMEYFAAKDLKQIILERGTLSQQETLNITLQITKALSYAHAHGIIHRDIKPGNIMVDKKGLVKIADFGIAAATDEASVTVTGHVIGTPEYMSAEQARGEPLDSRSDLYSLGMVVYEMLTGQTSFSGISKMAILGKLVYEKKEYELVFQNHILPSVQHLVSTLLKKNKDERISDTTTLVNLLNKASSELKTNISQAETVAEIRFSEIPLGEPEISHVSPPASGPYPQASNQKPSTMPESPKSEEAKIPFPKKPPSRFHWPRVVFVLVGLAMLFASIAYYLSIMDGKPPALPISSPLDKMKTIQTSIRQIQTKLAQSQKEADSNDAPRWAKDIYGEAFDLQSQGATQLDEANEFIKKERFTGAKTRLQNTLQLFSAAHEGFVNAADIAQKSIIQSKKLKAEQEKAAQLKARAETERLKRERLKAEAERRQQEILARAEQEELKQAQAKIKAERQRLVEEKAKAEKKARASAAMDMKYLGDHLVQFKVAYERKDLVQLQAMSQLSEKRVQFLKQIFDNYKTVKVEVINLSAIGNEASATISIQELTSFDGNRVLPSNQWKNAGLHFKKTEGKWGKATW